MVGDLLILFTAHPPVNHFFKGAIHPVSFLVKFYRGDHKSMPVGLQIRSAKDFLRDLGIFDRPGREQPMCWPNQTCNNYARIFVYHARIRKS